MKNLEVFLLGAVIGLIFTVGALGYHFSQIEKDIDFLIGEIAKNTAGDIKQNEVLCLNDMLINRELFSDEHVQLYADKCMNVNEILHEQNYTQGDLP